MSSTCFVICTLFPFVTVRSSKLTGFFPYATDVWRPLPDWLGGEQPYDLNSWGESETALALADSLDEDAVIVEGYAEYATWRPHLAYLRDPLGDQDMEMEIDGVGGVSILAKARVFRAGVNFPAFSFEKHAETEGFGKVFTLFFFFFLRPRLLSKTLQMAKLMGFSVVGLPHYTIWHLYEPSVDDIRHMEEMEEERKIREAQEKMLAERRQRQKEVFQNPQEQREKDTAAVQDILEKDKPPAVTPLAGTEHVEGNGESRKDDNVKNTGKPEGAENVEAIDSGAGEKP